MENIKLNAYPRDAKLEAKSVVKAELYGPGVANQHLLLDGGELDKLLTKANRATLIDLVIDGKVAPVLIREIQREPLKGNVVHIDFLQIDQNKKIIVDVDLDPVGKSIAISNLGATLVKNKPSLRVECMPKDLVSKLEVDLSKLEKVSDVIRVQDLILTQGLTAKNHPREAVFSLSASRKGRVNKGEEGATAPTAPVTPAKEAAPAKKEDKKKK